LIHRQLDNLLWTQTCSRFAICKLPFNTSRMLLDHSIDEAAQETLSLRAVETVDLHAVTVGDYRRKSAHLVPSGDLHVLVGIDDAQQESAVVIKYQFVQQRCQYPAWRTPISADVHQHRDFMRTLHDVLIEVCFFNVV
jgi:hypothetical protein